VPWHLTTREVAAQVRSVLRPDGLYLVNLIDHPPLAFARAEIATIAAVFPSVAVVASRNALAGRDGGNLVVLASARDLPIAAIRTALARRAPELALLSGPDAVAAYAGDAEPLTDDHAPVDQLLTPYAG
jgi:hypothetical protein